MTNRELVSFSHRKISRSEAHSLVAQTRVPRFPGSPHIALMWRDVHMLKPSVLLGVTEKETIV